MQLRNEADDPRDRPSVQQGVRHRVRATMGFYAEWILPSLIDLSMHNKRLRPYRARTAGAAAGCVLDIGIGSALQLPFYARQARRTLRLNPSPLPLAPAPSQAPPRQTPAPSLQVSAATS